MTAIRRAYLFISLVTLVSPETLYKSVDCGPKKCIESNFTTSHEFKLINYVDIEAKRYGQEDYEANVQFSLKDMGQFGYLSHSIKSLSKTSEYFHVNSGLWIMKAPVLGNGFLDTLSINVSHVGTINLYSLALYKKCTKVNMFWSCLEMSNILAKKWTSQIELAVDDLKFSSASSLEETFYTVNKATISLTKPGHYNQTIGFMIQRGNFIGFESVNATLISYDIETPVMLEYRNYMFPSEAKHAPFSSMCFQYKTYQSYEVNFDEEIIDYDAIDVMQNSTFDISGGSFSVNYNLSGYFSSYTMQFKIFDWESLKKVHDSTSFTLQAIIDGNLVGIPKTSHSLSKILSMPPPAKIVLSKTLILYPDTTIAASLVENSDSMYFKESITSYNWTLSMLPSNAIIKTSSQNDHFDYENFVMTGDYKLALELETIHDVVYKTSADIRYVSKYLTLIKCLRNCKPSLTNKLVELQLTVDPTIISNLNFEVASIHWNVAELGTDQDITQNVSPYNDLTEISIDTSKLNKKEYVVHLDIVMSEGKYITVHDMYYFNMSYTQRELSCNVFPNVGISLESQHNVSCILSIDNIICSLCEDQNSDSCDQCLQKYIYFFKVCQDNFKCDISVPLIAGNRSHSTVTEVYLPVGNETYNFTLGIVISMFDETETVELAHELVDVISKPSANFDMKGFLASALLDIDNKAQTEIFEFVKTLSLALSNGKIYESNEQEMMIALLKKAMPQDIDQAMMLFSVLLPLSKMELENTITKDIISLTKANYDAFEDATNEIAKSATHAALEITSNCIDSNAEDSYADHVYSYDSPDSMYYNQMVDFDHYEESRLNNNSALGSILCSSFTTFEDFARQTLLKEMPLGKAQYLNKSGAEILLVRQKESMLMSSNSLVGRGYLKIPPLLLEAASSLFSTFIVSISKFKENPCKGDRNSFRVKSNVIQLNITESTGKDIISGFKEPVNVLIPLENNRTFQEFLFNPELSWSYLQLEIPALRPDAALILELLTLRKTDILIKRGGLPKLLDHDFKYEIPDVIVNNNKTELAGKLGFQYNSSITTLKIPVQKEGTYYLGIRVMGTKSRRFWILPYWTSCLKWNGYEWSISSSNVGILSSSQQTHCTFDELGLYGADLNYPQLSQYKVPLSEKKVFKQVMENFKIWIPIIVVYSYVLLIAAYVSRLDERDIKNANLLHLLSPYKTDHSYKIIIKTGLRPKAGTTSNVFLELHGSKGSRKITIEQKDGELFRTNQISAFLFYSDEALGRIDKVHVYIDYSGALPDWFLESVRITDAKDRSFTFYYNNWIGYDIERYACSIPRFRSCEVSFVKRLCMSLSECFFNYHTAICYILKGTRSFPPRIYLLSLFMLRCLTLLSVIAYQFKDISHQAISVGEFLKLVFYLTATCPVFFCLEKLQELLHRNECFNFLITKMVNRQDSEASVLTFDLNKYFWLTASEKLRKSGKPAQSHENCINQQQDSKSSYDFKEYDAASTLIETTSDKNFIQKVSIDDYFTFFWDDVDSHGTRSLSLLSFERPKPLRTIPNFSFKFSSRWLSKALDKFVYAGIFAATACYLLIMYMIKVSDVYGCLIHYFLLMVLLLFFEQPLVCVVTTVVYAKRLWYGVRHIDRHCDVVMNSGEAAGDAVQPPVVKAWFQSITNRRMLNTVATKLFSYILFIVIVVILSKSDRKTNNYFLNQSLRRLFATEEFTSINCKDDFWFWIQNNYSSTLSSENFYKGARVKPPREIYLPDSSSIIISISRMRQLRIKQTPCAVKTSELCSGGYCKSLNEEGSFDPGWKQFNPQIDDSVSESRKKSYWKYNKEQDGFDFRGQVAVYPSGGYNVPIAKTPITATNQFRSLERLGWIDKFTRVVFVELSVYNPPTGFLCTIKLITEFLPTGTAISDSSLHSINFLKYSKPITLSVIQTEVLYILSLLILTIHFAYTLHESHKKDHHMWRGFWTVLDCATLFTGWASVAVYLHRYQYFHTAIKLFREAPRSYIDFHGVAEVDVYFGYCMGLLVFLVTIKIIDLMLVHAKIKLMTLVIRNSILELLSFAVTIFILLAVFSQVFFLLYSSNLVEFNNALRSFGQTIAFILGENEWDSMIRIKPYLTPFFGMLLGVISLAYIAHMFAVIVCYNTNCVRLDPPNFGHLAIFKFLKKTILDVVFFLLPVLGYMATEIKKRIPGSHKVNNPYFETSLRENISETDSTEETVQKENKQIPLAVMEHGHLQERRTMRMKQKLIQQTKLLKKLHLFLGQLEFRLNKL